MQFCKPVISQYPELCDKDPRLRNSAINRIYVDPVTNISECVSLGQYNIMAFNATPSSLTGTAIYYFWGSFINHITTLSSVIYLECDPTQEMSFPIYRHQRIANDTYDEAHGGLVGGQSHFNIHTRHACHTNTSGPGIVKWNNN